MPLQLADGAHLGGGFAALSGWKTDAIARFLGLRMFFISGSVAGCLRPEVVAWVFRRFPENF